MGLKADTMHHVVYSFALAVAGAIVLGAGQGAMLAAGAGLVKECVDEIQGRGFDRFDLAADLVGIVLALLLVRVAGVA